jgi:hypothetical protein
VRWLKQVHRERPSRDVTLMLLLLYSIIQDNHNVVTRFTSWGLSFTLVEEKSSSPCLEWLWDSRHCCQFWKRQLATRGNKKEGLSQKGLYLFVLNNNNINSLEKSLLKWKIWICKRKKMVSNIKFLQRWKGLWSNMGIEGLIQDNSPTTPGGGRYRMLRQFGLGYWT